MTRSRWLGFFVMSCTLAGASVGCSDWFSSDLNAVPPPDAAKADGPAGDGQSEASTEAGSEGGGNDAQADTGTDAPADAADGGKDSAVEDASDGAVQDADDAG